MVRKKTWKELTPTEKNLMVGGYRVDYAFKKKKRISYAKARKLLMASYDK